MGGWFIFARWRLTPGGLAWRQGGGSQRRVRAPIPTSVSSRLSHAHVSHWLAATLLSAALGACSGSPLIDFHAADYRETEASAGDSQLLLNILRAKDDLPIHFADLSIIHGSIQMTASATATLPFANLAGSTTPSSVSPTLGAQTQPTFDVGTLDTQDFTRGMLSPVSPQIVKQLFDQGVDPRLIMMLFFSEYRDGKGHVFQNNMSCDLSRPFKNGECYNRIYNFLDQIDGVFIANGHPPSFSPQKIAGSFVPAKGQQHLYANVYVALTPIGGELSGPWTLKDNFGDLRQLDTTKFKLIDKHLYAISEPRLAICYETQGVLTALFDNRAGISACRNSWVIVHDSPSQANAFSIRSSYEIMEFLGQVLRFQQEKRANRCLTLSVELDRPETRTCDGGEVLFQVNGAVGVPVVSTRYADAWYTINNRSCDKESNTPCDYSLQVLAILELLINANKAAKDIPSTPRVQVVP